MVQLFFLTGRLAGRNVLVPRLPWRIGRAPDNDTQLNDAGVWDQHLELGLDEEERIVASVRSEAAALVNGANFTSQALRNGDLLELGSAKIRFWLSNPRQYDMRWREIVVWLSLVCLCLGQIALVYWLGGL
jgi:pSer/pThr/pTyr-binding forkhead associated (FHA) protein